MPKGTKIEKNLPNFLKASCSHERNIQRIFFSQKAILDYKYIESIPAFFNVKGVCLSLQNFMQINFSETIDLILPTVGSELNDFV